MWLSMDELDSYFIGPRSFDLFSLSLCFSFSFLFFHTWRTQFGGVQNQVAVDTLFIYIASSTWEYLIITVYVAYSSNQDFFFLLFLYLMLEAAMLVNLVDDNAEAVEDLIL